MINDTVRMEIRRFEGTRDGRWNAKNSNVRIGSIEKINIFIGRVFKKAGLGKYLNLCVTKRLNI